MTENRIPPNKIYPTQEGKTVLNGTHVRDYPQSGLEGKMHPAHMVELAGDQKRYYDRIEGEKGSPETSGGTGPKYDIEVRGRTPCDGVREMRSVLGDEIPMMALIRSNAGAAMDDLPPDVVKSYIHQMYDAGMDVFRNFHAHNDARQFRHIYDAVKEKGGHFQAAYSWAVNNDEPALYNPRSVVKFFHELLDQGIIPDSWVLKDPSGVLTPTMAELITLEVKNDPRLKKLNLPFGIHTHNQMGQAPASCLAAAQAGANFIDVGPSFNNVPAQPAMPTMFHMLDNAGIDLGFGNDRQAKMEALQGLIATDEHAKRIAQSYEAGRRPRMEDVTVEDHGIAGGQSSIAYGEMVKAGLMTKEEAAAGVPIFTKYPQLQELIRRIRKDAGAVCQVTPAADRYFREGVRLLLGCYSLLKEPEKFYAKAAELAKANFNESHAHILTGAAGTTAKEINPEMQKQALVERFKATAKSLGLAELSEGGLSDAIVENLMQEMHALTEPARILQRREILNKQVEGYVEMVKAAMPSSAKGKGIKEARITELYRTHIRLIEQKLAVAAAQDADLPKTLQEVIIAGKKELDRLANRYAEISWDLPPSDFEALQYGTMPENSFHSLFADILPEALKQQPFDIQRKLLAAASVTTVVASDMMEPGLPKAKQNLIKKSQAHGFTLPFDQKAFDEAVTVEGMFGEMKIPVIEDGKKLEDRNIVAYLFKHRNDPSKWPVPDDPELKQQQAEKIKNHKAATTSRFRLEVSADTNCQDVLRALQEATHKNGDPAKDVDPRNFLRGVTVCEPQKNGKPDKHVFEIMVSVDRATREIGKPNNTSNGLVVHRLARKVAERLQGEVHASQVMNLQTARENGADTQIAV